MFVIMLNYNRKVDFSSRPAPSDDIIRPMSLKNLINSVDYQVSTPVFEGPLDLLLELIERAELDITTISLAKVTDQFLANLQNLSARDTDMVSGFIVIAAKLIFIKSVALLPRPSVTEEDEEEDPGEALVRQLKEYKKFKQVALYLEERERAGLRTYLRLAAPVMHIDPKLDMTDLDLADLVSAAQEILQSTNGLMPIDEVISLPRVTIREKIENIIHSFRLNKTISFSSLLSSPSKVEIVITFLAILELIKQNLLEVSQEHTFSDINIRSLGNELDTSDLDTEF